jgi:hypothetical protein
MMIKKITMMNTVLRLLAAIAEYTYFYPSRLWKMWALELNPRWLLQRRCIFNVKEFPLAKA